LLGLIFGGRGGGQSKGGGGGGGEREKERERRDTQNFVYVNFFVNAGGSVAFYPLAICLLEGRGAVSGLVEQGWSDWCG